MDSMLDSKKEISNFYELSDPFNKNALRLTVRGYSDWVTSDFAYSLFRGTKYPDKAISLGGYMGGQEANFMWTDLVFMSVISSSIQTLLMQNDITGWKTYPVEVFDRKGMPLPEYHGFSVIGKECRRNRSRSQVLTKQAVPSGEPFEVYKGMYFFEEDWDGSDIFLVQNNMVVVTERVRNLFKKSKVTNVKLIPLAEVEMDVYLDEFEKDI
jgi:hypothetical protein